MSQEPNNVLAQNLNTLALMYQLEAVLIEMSKNISLISQGANGQVITVNGANLFVIAAKYYGDATLWTTIAQANGLTDPELQPGTPFALVIPQTTTDTGGVLQT